jgi:two-component system, NtrC family, sensor kinase
MPDVPQEPDRRLVVLDDLRQAERRATSARVASIIAHLIGTPLHVIAGRASLIRSVATDPAIDENARRIEEQVERLAQRIRTLIDYLTPPDAAGTEEQVEAVVSSALALYGPIAKERGVTVRRAGEPLAGLIEGSSALIILTSLLSLASRIAGSGATCELAVSGEGPRVLFDVLVPGMEPPSGRLDTLEPPEHPVKGGTEALQVLSLCAGMARRANGSIEIVPSPSGSTTLRYAASLRPSA